MSIKLLKYGMKELGFIRSFADLKIFYNHKLCHLIPAIVGPSLKNSLPRKLQIEPTNLCNLKCLCCSNSKIKRSRGFMDYLLFQKIVDDAAEIGVSKIHLYLQGEPLLHPAVVDMIRYIKLKGLAITMATNGMLLDKEKGELILRSGMNCADYIIVSILGYSKKVHEGIMKGVEHERVLDNVYNLLEMRRKLKINGPIIETVFYTMPENEHEESRYLQFWEGKVDHVLVGGKISQQFTGQRSLPTRKKTCRYLWERMAVFWDGQVARCIADYDGLHMLGSLAHKSIKEIWNSNEALSIKEQHRSKKFGDIELCSQCDW